MFMMNLSLQKGAGNDIDKVEREDEFIVESVNKGIQSSFYKAGRYSPSKRARRTSLSSVACSIFKIIIF